MLLVEDLIEEDNYDFESRKILLSSKSIQSKS